MQNSTLSTFSTESNVPAFDTLIIALESKMDTRGKQCYKMLEDMEFTQGKRISFLQATTPDTLDMNNVHPHALTSINDRRSQVSVNDLTRIQQAACADSHIRAWKEVVRRRQPMIICEDDIAMYQNQLRKTQHALEYVVKKNENVDVDMLSLLHLGSDGYIGRLKTRFQSSNEIFPISYDFYGLQCYYCTPQAANILLKFAYPISMHIDRYVSDCIQKGLKLYRAGNSICSSNFLESTLGHNFPRIYTIPGGLVLLCIVLIIIIIIQYKQRKK